MAAPPGVAPASTQDQRLHLREILADAIDSLPPRERWVWDATVTERRSYREIAAVLGVGKSTVQRIKDNARALLKERLIKEPLVREHLE
jgi:RNA polymerase sigma factor (sigma-70 family)